MYKNKYIKYKNKYINLKNQLGGDCDDEIYMNDNEPISQEKLNTYDQKELITIDGKCYNINFLYNWIVTLNKKRNPLTNLPMNDSDKQRLMDAYNMLHINNQPDEQVIRRIVIPNNTDNIPHHMFNNSEINVLNFEIPSIIRWISDYAFQSNRLKTIIIPKSVTHIGSYAFDHNELNELTFEIQSSIVFIGTNAFAYNQLTKLVIPSSVMNINDRAFYNNQLIELTIPNSNYLNISDGAFDNNPQLRLVTIPDRYRNRIGKIFGNNIQGINFTYTTIPDNSYQRYIQQQSHRPLIIGNMIYRIENNAYEGNPSDQYNSYNLITFEIPSHVNYIGNSAFQFNRLKTIIIPNSVKHIGNLAFANNQLTELTFEISSSVNHIGNNAFFDNKLTNITIPNSVNYIGNRAFANNLLTEVTIARKFSSRVRDIFGNNQRINFNYKD